MKNKIQIIAGILAMYVLSLPVILIFHSQLHIQEVITIGDSDIDNITAADNSDCQICNFYFDQQLYVENSVVDQFDTFFYYFHQNIVESPVVLPQEHQYLRGPPII